MLVPKGRSGSWFAEWEGESLPCIHEHWRQGSHYHDPGVGDHRAWPGFKAGLRTKRRAILTTSRMIDGVPRRSGYVGIWEIGDLVEGPTSIEFDLIREIHRFKRDDSSQKMIGDTSAMPASAGGSLEGPSKVAVARRRSKNDVTIEQLAVACRHFTEMLAVGASQNLSVRTLELWVDVYAKRRAGGSASPDHARQVPKSQWSLAALAAYSPDRRPADYLRVEHGTPRRALALSVFALWQSGQLDKATVDDLVARSWKRAVITLEEDARLNKVARSIAMATPDERWALADIRFPEASAFRDDA